MFILLMVPNCAWSQINPIKFYEFENKITDCFFIDNNIESVELVCDENTHIFFKNICYLMLFVYDSRFIIRLKVKYVKANQCQSKVIYESQKIYEIFPNLQSIDLTFIATKKFFYSFTGSMHKILNVSHNEIGSRYCAFDGSFEELDVSFNGLKLRSTECTFAGIIKKLNLSHNEISTISGVAFQNIKELHILDLSNNFMKNLNLGANTFISIYTTLQAIHLQNNRIEGIIHSQYISPLIAMEYLNLEGNELDQLDTVSFARFPKLNTIGISKNQFSCEYAKNFVQQWKNVNVIGNLCDQKGLEKQLIEEVEKENDDQNSHVIQYAEDVEFPLVLSNGDGIEDENNGKDDDSIETETPNGDIEQEHGVKNDYKLYLVIVVVLFAVLTLIALIIFIRQEKLPKPLRFIGQRKKPKQNIYI